MNDTIELTYEQLSDIRHATIEEGASTVWQYVNSVYDGEDVEYSTEIINNYTVDDVVDDAMDAALHCWVVDLRYPLTKAELEWVIDYGNNILSQARDEVKDQR